MKINQIISLLAIGLLLLVINTNALFAQTITVASGGTGISADNVGGTFTPLTGPMITETSAGELSLGFIDLTVPTGFEWNTSVIPTITVTTAPGENGNTKLAANFVSITATTIQVEVTSTSVGGGDKLGQIIFDNLQVRPTSGIFPNAGNITNTGTSAPAGTTNYGDLSIVPGAPSQVQVETANDGTGAVVAAQDFTAGSPPLTVYSISRDQFGNFLSNVAADTWSIVNPTGSVESTDLTNQTNATSTAFSSNLVGSGNIQATEAGLSNGLSGTITVVPGNASESTSEIQALLSSIIANGSSTSLITVTLKDEFGNFLATGGDAVVINSTAGTLLSTVSDNTDGTYEQSLQSSITADSAFISATLNSFTMTAVDTVVFFNVINEWTSSGGANPTAWSIGANWTLGTPTASHTVLIPSVPTGALNFPVLDVSSTIVSLEIESGASLNADPGFNLTIKGSLSGSGSLILDNTTATIGGDVSITNLNAVNSTLEFNGTNNQIIDGDIVSNILTISNTAPGVTINGNLTANTLTASGATIGLSGNLSVLNITSAPTTVEFNGTTNQNLLNFDLFINLTVNKSGGELTAESDVDISGTLTLSQGDFVIGSGRNLIAPNRTITSGQLRFLREMTNQGWYLLSSPINSTFNNFLDGTLTQGYTGSTLGNASLDSLQSNVLFYDETYPGTDLQRWRAPNNSTDNVSEGVGYFVYAFGNIAADARYNDDLPDTLDIGGTEFTSSVSFPVTYTATADTGWNLLGNPYGATLDWDDGSSWTKTNVDNTIYVWDKTANGGNGDYLVWNGVIGSLGNGLIAPFQGFWVKANAVSPVLSVDPAIRTTGGVFYKSAEKKQDQLNELRENPYIGFKLSTDGLEKESFIMFSEEGLVGKDNYDAYQLEPFTNSYLELYTKYKDGTALTINHLPRRFGKEIEIPIYLDAFKDGVGFSGSLSIDLNTAENIPESWELTLENLSNGNVVVIEKGKSLTFNYTSPNNKTKEKSGFKVKSIRVDSDPQFMLRISPGGDANGLPSDFRLKQNYPNPFNPSTTFVFELPVQSSVTLEVYDILGRKVASVIQNRMYQAGSHDVFWNASSLASGVYIYRILTTEGTLVKRMTLIK